MSSISYRLLFKITKKSTFNENHTCQRPISFHKFRHLWKERYVVLGEGNLVGWNERWTIRKEHSDNCLAKKWHCLQEAKYHPHSYVWGWFHNYRGCFSSKGTGELQVIHSRKNGNMYREILEKNLKKSPTSLGHGRNFVLQHNIDPTHTAKLTKELSENNCISTLNWPSQSPDLDPIENLWNTLKVKVHKRNPQNIKQLEELCNEEWGKVTLDQCGKWLEAVKQNRGYATKY